MTLDKDELFLLTIINERDKGGGSDVKIEVKAVFNGTSLRPDAFEVSYWIDGVKTQRTFTNQ